MKFIKEENKCTAFVINYRNEKVKFKPKMFSKSKMSLKEFALVALGIDPVSTEIIAMYIGKLGFDTYNKGAYNITIVKKTRNGIKGIIEINEKSSS